jgi:5-oxoprolinase (ATP-hydrolysing)
LFKSSRRIDDNISDLKAQIASNQKGIDLLQALILESGQQEVFSYMEYIQANAEQAVRELIKNFARSRSKERMLQAQDFLDDGSIINLCIKLNADDGSAVFDFTGTSPELKTNLNTPPAVVSSAILYALRAMIGQEIPLNQGCLKPINTIIPKNSFLYPSPNAPVVGGNVLSSQRIVDVILKAFGSCAGSQGCMNNISFGKEAVSGSGFGYYETIGGGAGAGPGWHGASGVHTHMTNTRITDPEILESRYPVLLEEFSIRAGSGGVGKYNGGDGLVRVFRFLDQLNLSVLTERRGPYHPYGLEGGSSGALGVNQLIKTNGELVDLGAKNSLLVHPGERLVIKTPGGGGYGEPSL